MKKSFFKRLTRAISPEEIEDNSSDIFEQEDESWVNNSRDGELTVDVFETQHHIIVKAIVAGVQKDDLEISVSRDMLTIRGSREETNEIEDGNYFHKELFWGSFSRTILLPQEVDIDKSEATEVQGMLTLKLPKVDKTRQAKIKVRTS